jgi:Spy/CpxP family protein refolding chaperone
VKPYVVALLLFSALAHAEAPPQASGDELAQFLYPPELVIKFRQEIALSDDQNQALKAAIQQAQARFLDLQWSLQDDVAKLRQALRAPRIDESAALAQVDRVLSREREVKKAQLALLIRIKNQLSPEQQTKLSALRGSTP